MISVGHDAVVVKNHSQGAVKIGEVYEILAIKKKGCACNLVIVDIGKSGCLEHRQYVGTFVNMRCMGCGTLQYINYDGIWWFDIKLFAPIESIDISELTEVLETEPFTNT